MQSTLLGEGRGRAKRLATVVFNYSPDYHPCSAVTKAQPREGDNQGRSF